ncbi:MAG: HesA/MoeB/ThiF family protein [Paracoccaceae bacterium]
MLPVLLIGVALWSFATLARVPLRLRFGLIGFLWLGVVLAHLVLPADAPLRLATGGDARPWVILAALALLGWGYAQGLRRLKARAAPPAPTATNAPLFSETELARYARHLMLREIGGPGQKKLKEARVLVIGAGGLGSPALLYLAAAGVGTIGVIDDDTVDGSNLQRQIAHTDDRIGMPKVHSAAQQMRAINPFIMVKPYHRRLTEADAETLFAEYDLILDGTDNFDTRYLVNATAARLGKPLIAAAITQWEGQISVYDPARGAPCFECVFPERPAPGLVPTCAEAGVIGPLPGVIGAMMALEAIKTLADAGESLRGTLLIYDALYAETRRIAVKRRAGCAACGG